MNRIKAILFDFDGVILESLDIKGWAFGKLFENFPEHVTKIVQYHHANGGISRFEKFRYIYKNILKKHLSEQQFQQLCKNFEALIFEKILECDFVPGAQEFLERQYQHRLLFVISSTPHKEIQKIVQAKGLGKYFKGVYGSPITKDKWIKIILNDWNLESENALFVGDSISDYYATLNSDIRFIGRISNCDKHPFMKYKIDRVIVNLKELEQLL